MVAIPKFTAPTVDAIFRSYEEDKDFGGRGHLGGSQIGAECDRALWYSFHWVRQNKFEGRKLRLFDTGHLEEARLVKDLRRIGVTVMDVDPTTGKQWEIRFPIGHFGGSADGVAIGFPEEPLEWHIVEFKTSNAKGWKAVVKNGVAEAKPMHYAQMQVYMMALEIEWAMYIIKNKDNEDLYAERVQLDSGYAQRMIDRATRIILSEQPPARIQDVETKMPCVMCDFKTICHEGSWADRNCRTCLHSTAVHGGSWHCQHHDVDLTLPEQRIGCTKHRYIPGLVNGRQIDAADDISWVEYTLKDGRTWRDSEQSDAVAEDGG